MNDESLCLRPQRTGALAGAPSRFQAAAFTLIELLVALTILSLVVVLVSSITNSASVTIAGSSKRMDSDLEGRAVLDRMAIDFGKMIKRDDILYLFEKGSSDDVSGNANDHFGFFSESLGYGDDVSPYSIVGYRVGLGATEFGAPFSPGMVLGRASSGLGWDQGLSFTTTGAFPAMGAYQIAGDLVFRMEYTFLMKGVDGAPPKYNENPFVSVLPGERMKDIAGIVVGIAVLDSAGRSLGGNTADANDWNTLINRFPDAHGNSDILSRWYPVLNAPPAPAGSIPAEAVRHIRVYQRTFHFNKK